MMTSRTSKRSVFDVMGTTVSLVYTPAQTELGDEAPDAVQYVFQSFDERYSLYRPESELSRVASGELSLLNASVELREIYAQSLGWRDSTGGAFTPHRPDGVIDLSGIVKALAMRESGERLRTAGVTDWCLNAGGDVLCSGTQPDDSEWSVGIVDPIDRSALLCAITLAPGRAAVATSGVAERGDHIWRSSAMAGSFRQVTVVAADIVTADVVATAIIAGGQATLDFATSHWSIDVLTVAVDGSMLATPTLRSALAG